MSSLFAFLETRLGRVLRYGFSVSLVLLIAWNVDWPQMSELRGQFSWITVIVGVLLAGLIYPLHAWRWWILLQAQELKLSLHWAHVVTWIGQFYNSFLLGGLGGDAARVFYLCRDASAQKTGGLASIAIDRLMGLLVLLSLAVMAFAFKAHVFATSPELRWLLFTVVAVLLAGAAGCALLLWYGPARWPGALRRRLGERRLGLVRDLLDRTARARGPHVLALIVTVFIWTIDFIAVWLFARGVDLPLPFLETCIAVAVAYTATALPLSVGGHGVREGALLFTLGVFRLLPDESTRERAMLVALLVWATTMLWSLVGGIVLLAARRLLPPVIGAEHLASPPRPAPSSQTADA